MRGKPGYSHLLLRNNTIAEGLFIFLAEKVSLVGFENFTMTSYSLDTRLSPVLP